MCISRFFVLLGLGLSFRKKHSNCRCDYYIFLRDVLTYEAFKKNAFQKLPSIHAVKINLASIYLEKVVVVLTDR